MQSVLVTGGAGYIGSHACKALARAGFHPVTFDNLSTGHRWAVKWGPFINGDLADRELLRRTFRDYRIEAVIHFAANALVGESMRDPFRYLHDNTRDSLVLMETMREAGVLHVVFSSTCATYGIPTQVPIPETAPPNPVNPYGDSKLFVERALKWYEAVHGFSWVALRYFNAAGADRDLEIGECHDPETHLIPLVIGAALRTQPPVSIMGTDYPTPDGTAIRDYIHVEDLADAHFRALRYLLAGKKSAAMNLGTTRSYSVLDVIGAVERASGLSVPARVSTRRPGDPPQLVADNTRARELLDWAPEYQRIDEIVETAWRWHSSRVAVGVGSGEQQHG